MWRLLVIVVRLPFTLLGLLLVTLVVAPFQALAWLAILLVRAAFIPFAFLSAVFTNDRRAIREYMEGFLSIKDLADQISDSFSWIAKWGLTIEDRPDSRN